MREVLFLAVCLRRKNKLRESKTARKMGRVKELGGGELSFHFSCCQNRKSRSLSFVGLTLLRNHTETLATQATLRSTQAGVQAHFTKSGW